MRIKPSSGALAFFLCDNTILDGYSRFCAQAGCELWLEQEIGDCGDWRWVITDETEGDISFCSWVAVDSSTAPEFEKWLFQALRELEAKREASRIAKGVEEPAPAPRRLRGI